MTKRKPTEPNRCCSYCGEPLEPSHRADQFFCGKACGLKAFKARQRPECSFPGCSAAVKYVGICSGHYAQRERGAELSPLSARRRVADGRKQCALCEIVKPVDEFFSRSERDSQVNSYCKQCANAYKKARQYRVTIEEIRTLEAVAQCANPACDVDVDLNIDHCHDTGAVRGVLCKKCNLALGLANDDPKILSGLIAYLERSRT